MSFKVAGLDVSKGSKGYTRIKVAELLDGGELNIPVHVVNGAENGPVLGLFAGIHGSEYYQNRVIRKIVHETDPNTLKGTILAVPVANPPAFAQAMRQTPKPPEETVDFANLNRVFPGKRVTPLFGSLEEHDVSLTMRMASTITDNVLTRCSHVIDFHGQMIGMSLKKMLFNLDEQSKAMALTFGLGILHDPPESAAPPRKANAHMTEYGAVLGIPSIVPELGGGGHGESYEGECERICVQGTRNVMSHIGLIKGKAVKPERQFYFKHAPHVRALHAGYMVSNMQAEDVGVGKPTREVTKGEVLATIYNPYSLAEVEQIKAPCDGLLYACRVSGLVEPQNEVGAVADYRDSKWIE